MLHDEMKNLERYKGLLPDSRIEKAFDFAKHVDLSGLSPGRYEIERNEVFALVQEYDTRPPGGSLFEAHRRYMDVQIMLDGTEFMAYGFSERLDVVAPYDESKDAVFLDGERVLVPFRAGEFMVFFPLEPHMPGVFQDKSQRVRKVVIKVLA
jgi:biofilm protein TabA